MRSKAAGSACHDSEAIAAVISYLRRQHNLADVGGLRVCSEPSVSSTSSPPSSTHSVVPGHDWAALSIEGSSSSGRGAPGSQA